MKPYDVRHGQCDSIMFSKAFSLGRSKSLLDQPLGDN